MKTSTPYRPRAIRGISYPGHVRISRRQLARLFQEPGFSFSGFIVGNNVNTFHFFGGWHLAHRIENRNAEDMEKTLNGFEFHLDRELGNRAAIFLAKSAIA